MVVPSAGSSETLTQKGVSCPGFGTSGRSADQGVLKGTSELSDGWQKVVNDDGGSCCDADNEERNELGSWSGQP